jgi:hypothetical protein
MNAFLLVVHCPVVCARSVGGHTGCGQISLSDKTHLKGGRPRKFNIAAEALSVTVSTVERTKNVYVAECFVVP